MNNTHTHTHSLNTRTHALGLLRVHLPAIHCENRPLQPSCSNWYRLSLHYDIPLSGEIIPGPERGCSIAHTRSTSLFLAKLWDTSSLVKQCKPVRYSRFSSFRSNKACACPKLSASVLPHVESLPSKQSLRGQCQLHIFIP